MTLERTLTTAYAGQHPDAVARIVETSEPDALAEFLGHLPATSAAFVIRHASQLAIAAALAEMEPRRASETLQVLDPWSIAALVGRLDDDTRTRLLTAMSTATARQVQRLLSYEPEQIGSRMDPQAPSVLTNRTVEEVVSAIQQTPTRALYYVYVTDESQVLQGVVNMRELLSAPRSTQVFEIMTKQPERIQASETLENVVRHPAWRRVHALPVVDAQHHFLGALRYSVFRQVEAEIGQSLSGPDAARTASALAELFWLGASAVARTAESALIGSEHWTGRSTR